MFTRESMRDVGPGGYSLRRQARLTDPDRSRLLMTATVRGQRSEQTKQVRVGDMVTSE